MSTLEQQLTSTQSHRLVNLSKDLFESEYIPFRGTDRTIKRAEVAPRYANVGVIDVAVDDVGDDAVGMLARADLVRKVTE